VAAAADRAAAVEGQRTEAGVVEARPEAEVAPAGAAVEAGVGAAVVAVVAPAPRTSAPPQVRPRWRRAGTRVRAERFRRRLSPAPEPEARPRGGRRRSDHLRRAGGQSRRSERRAPSRPLRRSDPRHRAPRHRRRNRPEGGRELQRSHCTRCLTPFLSPLPSGLLSSRLCRPSPSSFPGRCPRRRRLRPRRSLAAGAAGAGATTRS
jgi:hypothetical protein